MQRKDALTLWLLRIALSLATAATVSALACVCAWQQWRNLGYFNMGRHETKTRLRRVAEEIERHQKATGKLPEKLSDLGLAAGNRHDPDDGGHPIDGWGRPIQYRLEPDGFALFSFGADGKPGGSGLDADLVYGKDDDSNAKPTLWQFVNVMDTEGMQAACLLAGALAFPVCLVASMGWDGTRASAVKAAVAHAVTAFFAVLAAGVMAALHIPSGH